MFHKQMLSTGRLCALFTLLFASILFSQTDPALIVYPNTSGVTQSSSHTIQVRKEGGEWKSLFCYSQGVGSYVNRPGQTTFASFDADFSSRIEVKIVKTSGTVSSVRIRPTSYGIQFTRDGNTVSFFLNRPRKLSIEFNGDLYNNVHLFANPPEVNPPKQGDPGVTYYGPGVTEAGAISLSSNRTIYIAGGGIVRGTITASNASNIKILGRGILQSPGRGRMIAITNCSNVTVDGITIVNSSSWTVIPRDSDNLTINNIKLINQTIYSDGINPCGCQNLTINDVFIRNGDDGISIKAPGAEANNDITVKNTIFWADGAHAVLFGPEGNGTTTHRIVFDSIEVLEVNCPAGAEWWGVVGITNSDDVTLRDVTLKNFNVDNFTLSELFNIRIETNQYVKAPGKCVKNIRYINWSYTGPNRNQNLITGYDASRYVDSIFFINLKINDKLILNAADANLRIGPNANNIFFLSDPSQTGIQAKPSIQPTGFIPARTHLASKPWNASSSLLLDSKANTYSPLGRIIRYPLGENLSEPLSSGLYVIQPEK